MSIDVDADTFDKEVIQSDRPVIVDFWGPQCRPCIALMPAVEGLAKRYGEKLKLVKVDASKNKRFCLSMKVLGLPTYLFYKDGKEVNRLTGGDISINDIEVSARELLE
jgi:thioredoxin 1